MLRLLVSAGGTGGGVYPALAVVEALGDSAEVLWIGGEGGMEVSLIEREGIPFKGIPAAGIHGVGARQLPGNLLRIFQGALASRSVVASYMPDVIFFTGGYVGIPVAYASGAIPKVVYSPDIEPGAAVRWISRRADLIAVTAEDSLPFFAGRQVKVTGYPVRKSIRTIDRAAARAEFGLSGDAPVLLVMGGSRGARSINQALWRALPELLTHVQVVHLTGSLDFPQVSGVQNDLPEDLAGRYQPFEYLHERMSAALGAADLALSRAGASILGEYTALGLASILVPYPHAWRYQKVNAAYLVDRGAAVMIADEQLHQRLLGTVLGILHDPERWHSMAAAAKKLAIPAAANSIADELLQFEGRVL